MHRVIVLGMLVAGLVRLYHPAAAEGQAPRAPLKVETTGVTATIKYEAVLEGFLTDLNGKYKLRVTEITIAPGGHVPYRKFSGVCGCEANIKGGTS